MEERDEAISGLADGHTQVLCSVDVVSEGTDVPAVSAAILLGQRVGLISASRTDPRPQPERSQLFWITLAALSNMALLMTFAFGPREQAQETAQGRASSSGQAMSWLLLIQATARLPYVRA